MFTTTIYYIVLQIVIFFVRRIFKSVCICMYNLYLLWILITYIYWYIQRDLYKLLDIPMKFIISIYIGSTCIIMQSMQMAFVLFIYSLDLKNIYNSTNYWLDLVWESTKCCSEGFVFSPPKTFLESLIIASMF